MSPSADVAKTAGLRSATPNLRPFNLNKPHRPPHFKKVCRVLAMSLPYARLADELSFDPLSTPECSFDSLTESEYAEFAPLFIALPGAQCPAEILPNVISVEDDEVQYLGTLCVLLTPIRTTRCNSSGP